MAKRKPADLNLLLAVDKPLGCTSHDVVAKVRRAVHERRVGHAGTLDPLATGVMIIGVGQATRLLGMLTLDSKSYIADIRFGYETNTDDSEGEPTRTVEPGQSLFDEEGARRVLSGFLGASEQVPPAFSAISVDGVRSYMRVRSGDEVVLPARPIEVSAADLISISLDPESGNPVWTVAFSVSKGTYIRALARDIGRAAGSAAHVSALRRTASGGVGIGQCLAVDGLDAASARERALDPVAALNLHASSICDEQLEDVLLGRSISAPNGLSVDHGSQVALVHAGQLRAVARVDGDRFKMEHVFPQGIEGVRG